MPLNFKFWKRREPMDGESVVGLRHIFEKDNGIELHYLNGLVRIDAFRPDLLRVRVTSDLNWPDPVSNAVVARPDAPYQFERTVDHLVFSTDKLRMLIPEGPFRFEIYDPEGKLLSRDFPGLGPSFDHENFKFHRHIFPEEQFYGLGDKYGPLARKGKVWTFWNRDAYHGYEKDPRYTSTPFLISTRPEIFCGWYIDHPGLLKIDAGKRFTGLLSITGTGADLNLYFFSAKSLKELVSHFTWLTGRSFLPPLWALGNQQSRWSYMSQEEVERLTEEFENRKIPLSAVYLDIHYLDRYKVFTVDPKRFPDLPAMTAKLAARGVRVITIIDSGVKVEQGYGTYERGVAQNAFCTDEQGREFHANVWPKKCAFPDFFQKETRDWWASEHEPLFKQGVAGIWNDMNEPAMWSYEIRAGNFLRPLRQVGAPRMLHKVDGRSIRHIDCRNLYGQKQCEATVAAFSKLRPGSRPFILSRSGFAGIQRLAAVWTADNHSTFAHLKGSITELLSLGLGGISFTGVDIGGFKNNCTPELFARWIQLGAFYPFCRVHSALGTAPQEPFRFGPEVEEIARKYLQLRYRLMPAIYSLFRENHDTGIPVWRPLMMEFPDDHVAPRIEDQVMFGEFLMLAPVTEAGKKEREFYLPSGGWTAFEDGQVHNGPGWIKAAAPLDRMPIFIREGAIIIHQPQPGLKIPWPELVIDLYPSAKPSAFNLYEDDGETLGYEREEFARRELRLEKTGKGLRFSISAQSGNLPVPPRKVTLRFLSQDQKPSMLREGLARQEFQWSAEKNCAEIEIVLDASARVIELNQ